MYRRTFSGPLVAALATAAALVVGVWLHPPAAFQTKVAGAEAAPVVVDSSITLTQSDNPVVAPAPETTALAVATPIDSQPYTVIGIPAPDATDVGPIVDDPSLAQPPTPDPLDVGPLPTYPVGTSRQLGGVPILMYHYIRINPISTDKTGFGLSVTPDNFALQMRFLASRGFTTVTMAQIRNFVLDGKPLPRKPIAITFDDGYVDAYTAALPVLQRYGQTATFYIITGLVDKPRYLGWDQVTALDRLGMDIGSHTVHHYGLPFLGGLARRNELVDSAQELEAHLGHAVLDFCYPSGEVDAATELAVRQTGYASATTTAYGLVNRGDDPLRLPRVRVWGGESLAEFAKLIGESAFAGDSSRILAVLPSPIVGTPAASPTGAHLSTRAPTSTATPAPKGR